MLQRRGRGEAGGFETTSGKEFVPSYTGHRSKFSNALRWDWPHGTEFQGRDHAGDSRAGQGAPGAAHPLVLAGIPIIHGVKYEFDAGRDSQLLENPEEIFLDGVLAEI